MPAAAVIPAPIAYIKVVAVKKLVVGFLAGPVGLRRKACVTAPFGRLYLGIRSRLPFTSVGLVAPSFTVKKLECLKQALIAVNTLAWNNKIGLWFYFVGWRPR